jgi:hypothetical protein
MMAVNTKGVWLCCKCGIAQMLKQDLLKRVREEKSSTLPRLRRSSHEPEIMPAALQKLPWSI